MVVIRLIYVRQGWLSECWVIERDRERQTEHFPVDLGGQFICQHLLFLVFTAYKKSILFPQSPFLFFHFVVQHLWQLDFPIYRHTVGHLALPSNLCLFNFWYSLWLFFFLSFFPSVHTSFIFPFWFLRGRFQLVYIITRGLIFSLFLVVGHFFIHSGLRRRRRRSRRFHAVCCLFVFTSVHFIKLY